MRAEVINAIASSVTMGIMAALGIGTRSFLRGIKAHQNEHNVMMTQIRDNADAIKKILSKLNITSGAG